MLVGLVDYWVGSGGWLIAWLKIGHDMLVMLVGLVVGCSPG